MRARQALVIPCLVTIGHECVAQRPDSVRAATPALDTAAHQSPARLAPVVVSGTRLSSASDRHMPAQTNAVDGRSFVEGPAGTVEAMLRLTGVSISNDQGTRSQPTLEIRGFSLSPVVGVSQGISVFLDGVRINEPDAQELYFDLIPVDAIDHAELTRGPTAIHGKNTLGGALNLVTKRGAASSSTEVEIGTGSYGALDSRVTSSGVRGDIDALLTLRASRESGYQAQSSSRILQLFSTVGRRTDSSDVALSLLVAGSRVFQAGSLPESWLRADRRANYTGGDFSHPALTQVTLRARRALDGAELRGNVFARRNDIEQYNVNVSDVNTRAFVTNTSGGGSGEVTKMSQLLGRTLALALGAEYAHSIVTYRLLGEPNDAAPTLPTDCDADGQCENARVPGDDAAIYGQALLHMDDRIAFLVSARGDYVRIPFEDRRDASNDGTNEFRQFSPKVGLTFTPTSATRAYASLGAGFRAPAALELACASPDAACPLPFSLGADPPLHPVVAWNREVGVDWTSRTGMMLRGSLFRSDVRDEIVFVTSHSAAGYFQNIPRTRRQGVEADVSVPLPHATTLHGSYGYVEATYRSAVSLASALEDNDVQPGNVFSISPRHRGSVDVTTVRAIGPYAVDAMLTVRGQSSQYLRGDEANRTSPMPGFAVADLRVRVDRGYYSVDAGVTNLLNRQYALFGVYAENPKGAPGAEPPARESIDRFFTPAYPRTVSVSFALHR